MAYGCTGRVLRVDLTEGKTRVEEPAERVYRSHLGGTGLALHYLLNELTPGVDPLGPENLLVFATSVLAGTPGPGLSRFTVAAKSPLTGSLGKSEAGGWWGPELKMAGFDAIVVSGRAERPVYLHVKDGEATLREAGHLWGRDTGEAEALIRRELGDPRTRIAQIGPAGERLVRFACVLNELKHANGRTGMGAVMGSKNLRAIAVRGTTRPALFDAGGVETVRKVVMGNYHRKVGDQHEIGTSRILLFQDDRGMLPTRNFNLGSFEGARSISGQTMRDTILVGRGNCYICPIACKRVVRTDGAHRVDPAYGGPEYETLAALGSLCGISDLAAVAKGNELCNRYGLDTISCGVTVAFAMECFEAGYLTERDTEGIDLRFGNADAMLQAIASIAEGRPLGRLLAGGALAAARRIGGGAEAMVVHARGQEFPMHDPRGKRGLALCYSLSPTGAEHNESHFDNHFEDAASPGFEMLGYLGVREPVPSTDLGPAKVRIFHISRQVLSLYNCIGLCQFVGFGFFNLPALADYLGAVTGWNTSLYELLKVGERAQNMARLFNAREGFTAADDALPPRMFQPPQNGVLQGTCVDRGEFEAAKRLYYEMAGWDPTTGIPNRGKLAELGLLEYAP